MCAFASRTWRSEDGLILYARDYAGADGEARLPVVCLHGLTRNSRDFEDIAPLLASHGRRVIVPEMRGRGKSDRDPNPSNYHYGTYAADVLRLLDELGISRAVFLGTSMGGAITMHVAAAAPERVAGTILNDVGAEIDPKGIMRITEYIGQPISVSNWDEATGYARRFHADALPTFDDQEWERFARRMFVEDAAGRPVLDYDLSILGASPIPKTLPERLPDMWDLHHQLASAGPILLLRGALSDILSQEVAERMAATTANLQLAIIPDVGHAPVLSEPVAVQAIEQFLQGA